MKQVTIDSAVYCWPKKSVKTVPLQRLTANLLSNFAWAKIPDSLLADIRVCGVPGIVFVATLANGNRSHHS
jgi:hypothetical protein